MGPISYSLSGFDDTYYWQIWIVKDLCSNEEEYKGSFDLLNGFSKMKHGKLEANAPIYKKFDAGDRAVFDIVEMTARFTSSPDVEPDEDEYLFRTTPREVNIMSALSEVLPKHRWWCCSQTLKKEEDGTKYEADERSVRITGPCSNMNGQATNIYANKECDFTNLYYRIDPKPTGVWNKIQHGDFLFDKAPDDAHLKKVLSYKLPTIVVNSNLSV